MLWVKKVFPYVCLVVALGAVALDAYFNYVDWQTADRSSSHQAPLPDEEKEAVVQLYAARTYNWRKYFAVHSWIAFKEKNAKQYTVVQVLGFKQWRTGNAIDVKEDIPDRKWYGAMPELLQTLKGEAAEKAILQIKEAVNRAKIAKEKVDEVIVGNVGQIADSGFIARAAMFKAGLEKEGVISASNEPSGHAGMSI